MLPYYPPAGETNHESLLSLESLWGNTNSLVLLNPREKAKFEAAGDLYQFQSMWRGAERKRHLKEMLGIKHELWNVLTVVQHSLKSEQSVETLN